MKSLVTGVTGFGGSHLAEHLLETGDTLLGIARGKSRIGHLRAAIDRMEFREVDILDAAAVGSVIREFAPDVIYHLAGEASAARSLRNPQETLRNNILGTVNLLEAARAMGQAPRVVLVTSSEMYGLVQPNELPLTERSPLRPAHPYGLSKVTVHYLGQMYHRTYGLPVVEARAFNHVGPRQSTGFVVPDFAQQIAEIAAGCREAVVKVGNLQDERDFTDVRDVARAYGLIGRRGTSGEVYQICSGKAHRIRWILDRLIAESGVDVRVVEDPARLRPSKMPLIKGSFEKLRKDLGWEPEIPIETSLRDTLAWWREQTANLKG